MTLLKCKKDLYKTTYKQNAFTAGQAYEIIVLKNHYLYIKDNLGNDFYFRKFTDGASYLVEDYFEFNEEIMFGFNYPNMSAKDIADKLEDAFENNIVLNNSYLEDAISHMRLMIIKIERLEKK